jgi:hypothetical protein
MPSPSEDMLAEILGFGELAGLSRSARVALVCSGYATRAAVESASLRELAEVFGLGEIGVSEVATWSGRDPMAARREVWAMWGRRWPLSRRVVSSLLSPPACTLKTGAR